MRDDKRTRLLLAVLLAAAFAMITVDARGGARSPLRPLRAAGEAAFGPVQHAVSAAANPVTDFVHGLGHSTADQKQITRLKAENAALREQNETSADARARAGELDKLLHVAALGGYRTVPARVLAFAPRQQGTWSATIDAGSVDGVRPGMTVLGGDGLIGRTTAVGADTATVLLAADPRFTVGVRTPGAGGPGGGGQVGLATGGGAGGFSVQFYDPQADIPLGTPVLTFGSSGGSPFVPGVPLGTVTAVQPTPGSLTRTATVKPYVDYGAIQTVGVVVAPPRTDPRDALVPPK
ncbi:rod shape-determining protein MreC [Catenulispora yoronensis]|uniref:Cell shape-determining protein MreC n=1 Tax=Catenulispora yoronensis TaxID=450799 RepID=A0ABN2TQK7_9ACTN